MKALVIALTLASSTAFAGTRDHGISIPSGRTPGDHGVAIPTNVSFSAIPVCFDFGCASKATVKLPISEWDSVAGWFREPAATPKEEREQIRKAIGWLEVLIGRYTPTHRDLEFDKVENIDNRETGQLDCIDESVNTTTYMRLFEGNGFLKHHVVIEEAYRKAIFDQHWAGQIREIKTGKRFVVDSWFQPNGHLPIVQPSAEWEDINLLSAVIDNSDDPDGVTVKRSFWHRFLRGE